MCGIAGFTLSPTLETSDSIIKEMVNSIRHRGPDAQAWHCTDKIALGHARLSIIDLSEAGTQPMHSEDGRYSMVFNGEIYNFQALRAELEQQGYKFSTHTDSEVALKLLISEGSAAISKLNGMFAIALWDHKAQSLLLIRDRIGKKPLYYSVANSQLIFASELKALLKHPEIEKKVRVDAVHDFFAYQYIPEPKTIFEGIFKLEPGTWLNFDNKKSITKQRYWHADFSKTQELKFKDAKETLLATIEQATKDRMISDVPLGAFLSGGVDSSGIVALMSKTGKQVTTCCIGFDDKKFNESEFAKIVADKYQTDHHLHRVNSQVTDRLDEITAYFDEPFADPSLVPTFFVSELAKKNVTVALTGDGGDEVFAGYSKYATDWQESKLRNKFPTFSRKAMGAIAPHLRKVPNAAFRKASSLMNSLSLDAAKAFYVTNSFLDDHVWQAIISDDFRKQLADYHPSELTEKLYNNCDAPDHLSKLLYTDLNSYLPGGILVKADRMSMAHALELRAPLLDYRVIEFANSLQSDFKFNKGEKKHILKETFKHLLPDDILYRKKMGFSTPLAVWFRTELKSYTEQRLFAPQNGLTNYFNIEAIKALWENHQNQRFDHSSVLWSLLMFEQWWQHFMADSPVTHEAAA